MPDPSDRTRAARPLRHDPEDLIELFAATFGASENTLLLRGDNEPLYLPAHRSCPVNRILFAHGFYASALHETAHWCLAGAGRRRWVDYGYWYLPDGRNEEQQAAFEAVEIRPQAIEWAFCIAAGFRFNVSVDNLGGSPVDRSAFRQRVRQQLLRYMERGFPRRAQRFIDVLCDAYGHTLTAPST
jgi:elongation factor P hydroxylase